MSTITSFLLALAASASLAASAGEQLSPVSPEIKLVPLNEVRILDGPFLHAQQMDKRWLLSLDPDRLLSGFRSEAGLEPKAPRYGGWEGAGVSGHSFGHYLSAMSMLFASTGDPSLLEKIDYSIDELELCQKSEGTGLLAGFERSRALFEEVRRGDIRSQGFDLNGGWVPFYTLHKEIAGLVDVCRHTPNKKALGVLVRFVDWLESLVGGLSDSQMEEILLCEHGGMTEALADVHSLTGERRHLELARRFDHHSVLHPLRQGVDSLAGKHANTLIPKIVGAAREYELTGEAHYHDAAVFFWRTVVQNHTYVIGGNSEYEHFGAPSLMSNRISDGTCETCNTYNMLKLTKHLFEIHPTVELADYYERALYNQVLASQNPEDGMVCYMSPLGSGMRKTFSLPFDSFWCCVGSGMENHARYGEFIYGTDGEDNIYVNLFIPSSMESAVTGIKLTQETCFPYSDTVRLRVDCQKPRSFSVCVRNPAWAGNGCEVLVNGKVHKCEVRTGVYIRIMRRWRTGDEIVLTLHQSLRSEPIAGDQTQRAYLYGPIVLGAALDDEEDIPVIVADDLGDPEALVEVVDPQRLRFRTKTAQTHQKELSPYLELGGKRMMVYFDHFPSDSWKERLEEECLRADREKWLAERTVSKINLGEMQPERDHDFKGENSRPGEVQGRKFRESAGGWFSFDLEVDPDSENTLYCTFWGACFHNHSFDIEIDGAKVGFENIHNWGDQFVERSYIVPIGLTRGKSKVTVTVRAIRQDAVAGPLVDCRMMRLAPAGA